MTEKQREKELARANDVIGRVHNELVPFCGLMVPRWYRNCAYPSNATRAWTEVSEVVA